MRKLLLLAGTVFALAQAAPAVAARTEVRITSKGFSPSAVSIAFGDTVTWRNVDRREHQIVANTGTFASSILKRGATYSFTFSTSGRFRYHDALKPSLKGRIDVQGPPPSLTLGVLQPIVIYGQPVTLTGTVSSGKAGETVTIMAKPYGEGAFSQLAIVQTSTGGGWSYQTTPSLLTLYEAEWGSTKSGQAGVQVKPKLTFVPRVTRFVTKVSGGKSFAGRYAYLQRRSPLGEWINVQKLTLGPLSGRIFALPAFHGVYTFRIYMPVDSAGPGYLDGSSGTQRVTRR